MSINTYAMFAGLGSGVVLLVGFVALSWTISSMQASLIIRRATSGQNNLEFSVWKSLINYNNHKSEGFYSDIIQDKLYKYIKLASVLISLITVIFVGLIVGICVGMAFWAVGLGAFQLYRDKQKIKYEDSLIEALDQIERSVRSGANIPNAILELNNKKDYAYKDLRICMNKVAKGAKLSDSLEEWAVVNKGISVRLIVSSIQLALRSGVAPTEAIELVATTLRQRKNVQVSISTQATQAKASSFALIMMPLAVSGPMMIFDKSAQKFMLYSIPGNICLLLGMTLITASLKWMNALIKKAAQ